MNGYASELVISLARPRGGRVKDCGSRHFDPKRRFHIELKSLEFEVRDLLFATGDDYLPDLKLTRTSMRRRVSPEIQRSRIPLRRSAWRNRRV